MIEGKKKLSKERKKDKKRRERQRDRRKEKGGKVERMSTVPIKKKEGRGDS